MPVPPPRREWSFLAYIGGDNNLSDYGISDLIELAKEGVRPTTYAGVEIDTQGEHDGSVRYEITEQDFEGEGHRTVIERLKELDSGSAEALGEFLKWGFRRYPARQTLAAIWSHGWGFKTPKRGIVEDQLGSTLDMNEVVGAFQSALPAGERIAIVGFDACLMNMLEVANHLRDVATILVGSQAKEPADGWPYDEVLAAMNRNPNPAALAAAIVDTYLRSYENSPTLVTQSAIDLDRTDAALKALHSLGGALRENYNAKRDRITRCRLATRAFDDYIDIRHFVRLLVHEFRADDAIVAACLALDQALAGAIIHAGSRDERGQPVADIGGLSCWFPLVNYFNLHGVYTRLKGCEPHTGWVRFLNTFHGL